MMRRSLITFGCGLLALAAIRLAPAADKPAARTVAATSTPGGASKSAARNYPQVEYINQFIRQGWQAHGLQPSGPATDGEWCRRVFLDVIGRTPTIEEVEQYTKDRPADRKQKLIDRLLSDQYVEEYARNWSNIWSILLVGRPPENRDRTFINREGMAKYLRDTFARNKPYDQMVYDLVSATGSTQPGEENFNGAANFLVDSLAEDAAQATAKTAKLFMGMQVQCTQCHNHPFNDWKQNQFWELNAFFRQTKREGPRRPRPGSMASELKNEDFAGGDRATGKNIDEAIIFYELRNGQMKTAFPVFVDGQEIPKSGRVKEVNRRDELGKLIVKSPYLSQAIVNRIWGHFLGYGFTKPVDDMGPHNPPTHPELLERLASDFTSHSHDLKQLMRWIVLSEPYGLSSKMKRGSNDKDDPALGEKPMFSHFYLRQMQAEQLYESLLTATEADKTSRGTFEEQERRKNDWLRQFTIAFGTDEGDDTTTFNGTITQMLMMFNGEMIKAATSTDSGNFLDRLAKNQKLSNAEKINYLYMSALSRKPTASEITVANQLLMARKGNPAAALQDVFWVLLNSAEFIFVH
jgi:hypothetical protein